MKPSLIIAGLGNPGKQHEHTRHNLGFRAVDVLSEAFGTADEQDKPKFRSLIREGRVVTVPILFVKPQTYMNCSGEALKKIVDFYDLDPSTQLLVICDDVDVSLGETRLRQKGSAGTHNGLKSVVEQFGEDFPRLRIGIGPAPEGADLATWVLSRLSSTENIILQKVLVEAQTTVENLVLGEEK